MGQSSERLPLENKRVATPFRNNTKSEECGISCFRGEVKNIFASTAYQAPLIKIFVKESKGFAC